MRGWSGLVLASFDDHAGYVYTASMGGKKVSFGVGYDTISCLYLYLSVF
jgi:hypothetical protein